MAKEKSVAWVTLLNASRESGAHYSYIALLARNGVIESKRFSGRVLLSRASFEKWNEKYQTRRQGIPAGVAVAALVSSMKESQRP